MDATNNYLHLKKRAINKFNIPSVLALLGNRQDKSIVSARLYCYQKLWNIGKSHGEIGKIMNKERTTVLRALKGAINDKNQICKI